MNAIRTLTAAVLLLASSVSLAASPTQELRWDCTRAGAPSYREIADAFGFDNYVFAREAQTHLYFQLRRECERGAAAVLVILKPHRAMELEAVAAR